MMFNPYQRAGRQYLFDMLQERYEPSKNFIERITVHIGTEDDLKCFAKMIADVYELGFLRATNQYRNELAKLGYNVTIVPEQKKE